MEPQGEDFDPDGSKSPKITKIGKNWIFPNDSKNSPTSSFLGDNTAEHEFEIDPSIWSFEANQNADFTLHEDGMIELCVLQEKSTPGIKTSEGIHLPAGNYVFTVVAHSEVSSTFFPFAIDSDDNIYVGGLFSGTVDFDPGSNTNNLISDGPTDAFVLKLNEYGGYINAFQGGGSDEDECMGLYIDESNFLYTCGNLNYNAMF